MVQEQRAVIELPRGGRVIQTSIGSIQFGVPPETIKDTMVLESGVPSIFVLAKQLFDLERAVNLAELEFPVYFNFFVCRRRITVVCTATQRERVLRLIGETLFAPVPQMLYMEFLQGQHNPALPDMARELSYFQRHPRESHRNFTIDDILEFKLLEEDETGDLSVQLGDVAISLNRESEYFSLYESHRLVASIPWNLRIPLVKPEILDVEPFDPPTFGITALGTGSGFDPASATSGFVVWVNGRGIMVDPPVDSTLNLREQRIAPRLIQDIILTHCHADHDAGVLQKVMEEGIIRLYTTPSIMEGFLRKASLITGLAVPQIEQMIEFHPVPIAVPFAILGARFVFKYNFHSVPTIRFQIFFRGKSIVYSSDILNIPEVLEDIHRQKVFSDARFQDLLSFPWDADIIIHEAGIPPLHTPPSTLSKLPAEIKNRLHVVHTTEARVKDYPDLRMMQPGIDHTLAFDLPESPATLFHRSLRTLASNDSLRGLSIDRAADLLQIAEHRTLAGGEYLIKRGETGHEIYLLLHGEVSVIRDNREYKVYGAGELVGDMALVNDEPRFADVVARSRIRYLAIHKLDFISLLQHSGVLEYLQHLAEIRKQDSWPLIEFSPVFDFLTVSQRTQLQGLMRPCELNAGDRLSLGTLEMPEGHIIIEGQFRVQLVGDRVGVLKRGGLLGAFGSPDGTRESGSWVAIAEGPVQTYRIGGLELQSFLERNPGMWLRLNRRALLDTQLS